MKKFLIAYAGAFLALLVLDVIWLSTMARSFYVPYIGHLMAEDPNFGVAAIFYLIYTGAIVIFGSFQGYAAQSLTKTILMGGFFGFAAYATYDLTNMATLKDWPAIVTIVDLVWGTFLSAVGATGGYLALKRFA